LDTSVRSPERIVLPAIDRSFGEVRCLELGIANRTVDHEAVDRIYRVFGFETVNRGRLIATSYSMAFGSSRGSDRGETSEAACVRAYVEQKLYDPDFKPGSIASAMRLDPRRVRQAFQGIDESASSYLLRRRLLEAARRLRDPRWRGHTIAEIAHCCGFASNERSIP
jgi:AraC-like DNA-binding protein